jgi:hypothetical protein
VEKWTKLVTEVSLRHFRASDSEIRSAYSLALDDNTELHALNRELKEEKKIYNTDCNNDGTNLKRIQKDIKSRKKLVIQATHKIQLGKLEEKLHSDPANVYRHL